MTITDYKNKIAECKRRKAIMRRERWDSEGHIYRYEKEIEFLKRGIKELSRMEKSCDIKIKKLEEKMKNKRKSKKDSILVGPRHNIYIYG